MKSLIFALITLFSCNNSKINNTKMDNLLKIDNYIVKISYHRQERSKDSNGSEKTFLVTDDKKIIYSERNWGFKALKNPKDITQNLSEEKFNKILELLNEKSLNQNFDEFIKITKDHSFNVFTYYMTVNKNDKLYNIKIATNDTNPLGGIITAETVKKLNSKEKVFYYTGQLFNYLKNILKEKK